MSNFALVYRSGYGQRYKKTLDKTVAGIERVKRVYVRTKDGAEHRQAQDTPEE